MKQQDLVWVKLPFSSLEESKIRPALIVSNNEYINRNHDVVVCAVTSNLEQKLYSVIIDNKNLTKGKIPIKSRIRADKIMQIEKNLIISTFAKIDNKTYDTLSEEIKNLIERDKDK